MLCVELLVCCKVYVDGESMLLQMHTCYVVTVCIVIIIYNYNVIKYLIIIVLLFGSLNRRKCPIQSNRLVFKGSS